MEKRQEQGFFIYRCDLEAPAKLPARKKPVKRDSVAAPAVG